MTAAIRIIQTQHANIWRVLDALDALREKFQRENGGAADLVVFEAILDYVESYADRVHHAAEDEYLFKALRRRAPELESLISQLESQHREGAELAARIRERLEACRHDGAEARNEFAEALAAYSSFVREHLLTEEKRLHPEARRVLTEEDWEPINQAFARSDDPLFGKEVREEFRDLYSEIVNYAPEPIGLGLSHEWVPQKTPESPLLEVSGLTGHYGRIQVLKGIDLKVQQGQLVALVGANGAGKTTLLRIISGLQSATDGQIIYDGRDIGRVSGEKRVKEGIAQVPEGRQVFAPLSVEDNIRLGAYTRNNRAEVRRELEHVYELFPILWEKRRQSAGTLSGGQQQMLAIGRAMMAQPRVLLLDEPGMGLAPLLVTEIFNIIQRLKADGITVLLVEQNAAGALAIADHAYVMETGRIVLSGPGPELLENEDVKKAYLGM